MRTGASLALIALGAILAFAVTANTSFLNLHTVGYVCMIVGIVGLYLRSRGWGTRQFLVRRSRTVPVSATPASATAPGSTMPGSVVTEERDVPRYMKTNPGTAPARAGLPVVPSIVDDEVIPEPVPRVARTTTERVEEFYEE